MAGATEGDREGQRITYGSFVRMMTHTVKQAMDTGQYIFRQGDAVRYFYALLNGEVEVVRTHADGREEVLNVLRAGEYFGENSLLSGGIARSVSIRCATPVEILKLSKADFEAGFGQRRQGDESGAVVGGIGIAGGAAAKLTRRTSGEENERRSNLISFIQMVSRQQHRTLGENEAVFREGEAADKFYILASGALAVHGEKGSPAHADGSPLGHISMGEGFGESALLNGKDRRSKTVTCATNKCEVVEILGADFKRLVEKSRVVRESFEWLNSRRTAHNARVQAAHEDQVLKKYTTR